MSVTRDNRDLPSVRPPVPRGALGASFLAIDVVRITDVSEMVQVSSLAPYS